MRLPVPCLRVLAMAMVLAGCVAPISVREVPVKPANPSSQALLATVQGRNHRHPAAASGGLLDDIQACQNRIAAGDPAAVDAYNFLVGRLIDHLGKGGLNPWATTISLRGESTIYRLSGKAAPGLEVRGQQVLPTDQLAFSGKYATPERILEPGLGAPVVIASQHKLDYTQGDSSFGNRYRAATAIVRVNHQEAVIELENPYAQPAVPFAGKNRPLAADYSSSVSFGLSRDRLDKIGILRVLYPQRYANTARLSFIQPYDPRRIPVLFVHGLNDTPATWMPMYLGLVQDPAIRSRYQFWVFSYPSGYPFSYSATLLRRELERVAREHPDHQRIVIIGHSMGGILSRMMVSDAGDTIWRAYFGKPPAETKVSGRSRQLLNDSLIFNARPDINRAVFISAPHRGSQLASNWVGRTASRLVRAPALLVETAAATINVVTADPAAAHLQRAPNSIDTLSPNNRTVRATSNLPIRVPYHSIMGDRGKGNSPQSSDGVVAYWSSHLEGAASEKIVPSGHSAHQNDEAIAEVRRILHLHADLPAVSPGDRPALAH